jgi:hypothetical protein
VILADGSPMGFFGRKQPHVSEFSDRSEPMGLLKSKTLKTGLNNKGVVFDYQGFRISRPWYIDAEMAKNRVGTVSCVLVINVSEAEATLFKGYWTTLRTNPGLFNLVGYNCSTRASQGFQQAGVTLCPIPRLDTPNNLYRQIVALRSRSTESYFGYVGFRERADGGFDVVIDELEPQVTPR